MASPLQALVMLPVTKNILHPIGMSRLANFNL